MALFRKGLIVLLVFGSLVLAACGGDSEDTSGVTGGNGSSSSSGSSSGSSGASSNDGGGSGTVVKEEKLSGEQGNVQSAVRSYWEAILKGDKDKGYDLLNSASKAKCTKAQFGTTVDGLLGIFKLFGQNTQLQRVYNVVLAGDTAESQVDFTIDGKLLSTGPLDTSTTKEGGKWLIEDSCS